jgi:hypothetical protein
VTYHAQTWAQQASPTLNRPGTLKAAMVFAVIAGVAAIANGIMILAGGRDLIMDILASSAGLPEGSFTEEDLSLLEGVSGSSMADLESTLATRAYLVLAFGLLLVLFAALMHKAAGWARAAATLSAALTLVFSGVIIADATTPPMALLCMTAILGTLIAAILIWLPANNRFAKAAR